MKTERTLLRRLWQVLSAGKHKILPNQVCFYHAVFAFTNPDIVSGDQIDFMEKACSSIDEKYNRSYGEEIKRIQYLYANALDGSSSNIGRHINHVPHFAIPPSHVRPYRKGECRGDIIRRLSVALQFSVRYLCGQEKYLQEICRELYPLLKKEFEDISSALKETDELDFTILSIVIYDVVSSHLKGLNEPLYKKKPDDLWKRDNRPEVKAVDMEAMRREYHNFVDCYGSENIDRYFALIRYGENNVLAAEELGCIYYYGKELFVCNEGRGNNGSYYVDADMDKAAYYFRIAASSNPPCIPACWSMGYMLLNMKFPGISGEEAVNLAEIYFKVAAGEGYMPARNSLGMIYEKKADKIRKKEPETGSEEQKKMMELYIKALTCYDQAGSAGWPYGHNNIAAFLLDETKCRDIIPLIEKDLKLNGPLDSRERYLMAAEKNNLWAMDQAALLEYKYGNRENAGKLWRKAAGFGYSESALHLAVYFYDEGGCSPDFQKYMECLQKASKDGNAEASCILAEYFAGIADSGKEETEFYLELAIRQNYEKFNHTLYHRIQQLRDF